MTRRQIMSMAVVALATFVISTLTVVLIPVWLIVLLINPDIVTPLMNKATKAAVRQGTRVMMRTPVQPVRKARS